MSDINIKKYPNNITLVHMHLPNARFVYLSQFFNIGSACFQPGLLHLFEHCAFQSPENIGPVDYRKHLNYLGIEKEAYTSREHLEFRYSALKEDVVPLIETFLSCYKNSTISEDILHREQQRIIDEINDIDPDELILDNATTKLLFLEPFAQEHVLGSISTNSLYGLEDLSRVMDKVKSIPFTVFVQSSHSFVDIQQCFSSYLDELNLLNEKNTPRLLLRADDGSLFSREKITSSGVDLLNINYALDLDYGTDKYLYFFLLQKYFAFGSGSPLSKYLEFQLGLYDYGIEKIFYKNIVIFGIFLSRGNISKNILKNIRELLSQEIEMNQESFLSLCKGAKRDILHMQFNEGDLYDFNLELFQVCGETLSMDTALAFLERASLSKMKDLHRALVSSRETIVLSQKEK